MMKQFDFRFDTALIKSFVGKTMTKYKHAELMCTNSVTGILGFEINNVVYELTNEYEAMDFLSLDDEATVLRLSKTEWNTAESMMNTDIHEMTVNETIKKVILVNDHTTVKVEETSVYDMWDTKAIIFCFKNHDICFAKQDCWFSQEIELYKGHNLLEKISSGKGILEDFDSDDTKNAFVERTIFEVS